MSLSSSWIDRFPDPNRCVSAIFKTSQQRGQYLWKSIYHNPGGEAVIDSQHTNTIFRLSYIISLEQYRQLYAIIIQRLLSLFKSRATPSPRYYVSTAHAARRINHPPPPSSRLYTSVYRSNDSTDPRSNNWIVSSYETVITYEIEIIRGIVEQRYRPISVRSLRFILRNSQGKKDRNKEGVINNYSMNHESLDQLDPKKRMNTYEERGARNSEGEERTGTFVTRRYLSTLRWLLDWPESRRDR